MFSCWLDVHVGSRLRLRRTMMSMSQEKLGNAVNLTFQQIQKYERGANRLSASKLYMFSHLLDVPISFFFDDLPSDVVEQALAPEKFAPEMHEESEALEQEARELVEAYYTIKDRRIRFLMRDLVRGFSGTKRTRARKAT